MKDIPYKTLVILYERDANSGGALKARLEREGEAPFLFETERLDETYDMALAHLRPSKLIFADDFDQLSKLLKYLASPNFKYICGLRILHLQTDEPTVSADFLKSEAVRSTPFIYLDASEVETRPHTLRLPKDKKVSDIKIHYCTDVMQNPDKQSRLRYMGSNIALLYDNAVKNQQALAQAQIEDANAEASSGNSMESRATSNAEKLRLQKFKDDLGATHRPQSLVVFDDGAINVEGEGSKHVTLPDRALLASTDFKVGPENTINNPVPAPANTKPLVTRDVLNVTVKIGGRKNIVCPCPSLSRHEIKEASKQRALAYGRFGPYAVLAAETFIPFTRVNDFIRVLPGTRSFEFSPQPTAARNTPPSARRFPTLTESGLA